MAFYGRPGFGGPGYGPGFGPGYGYGGYGAGAAGLAGGLLLGGAIGALAATAATPDIQPAYNNGPGYYPYNSYPGWNNSYPAGFGGSPIIFL